jgi:hypothetical protein
LQILFTKFILFILLQFLLFYLQPLNLSFIFAAGSRSHLDVLVTHLCPSDQSKQYSVTFQTSLDREKRQQSQAMGERRKATEAKGASNIGKSSTTGPDYSIPTQRHEFPKIGPSMLDLSIPSLVLISPIYLWMPANMLKSVAAREKLIRGTARFVFLQMLLRLVDNAKQSATARESARKHIGSSPTRKPVNLIQSHLR